MRISTALSLLFITALSSAQYMSEGWKPGKAVPTSTVTASGGYSPGGATPAANTQPTGLPPLKSLFDLFDIKNILRWTPIADRLASAGLNVSESIDRATKIWDDRVPLIDDLNYEDMIVEEKLTEQEEKDRVWIIIMLVCVFTCVDMLLSFDIVRPLPMASLASACQRIRSLTRRST